MATEEAIVPKTGLTLLEADQRIEALEIAAAKTALALAEALRHQQVVDKVQHTLVACVELLFTELKVEGTRHSQFVEDSLGRTAKALDELRAVSKKK
jgi:hypothetical protein